MITDINGNTLKVGQVILDIFFDEIAEIINVSKDDYLVVKYLKDGFFNINEVMEIKAIHTKAI